MQVIRKSHSPMSSANGIFHFKQQTISETINSVSHFGDRKYLKNLNSDTHYFPLVVQ